MKLMAGAMTAAMLLGSICVYAEEIDVPETPEELVAEEGAEIEFAYWEGSSAEEEAWNAVLDKFEEDHPEIKLTRQTYTSADFRDMLDTRIAGQDWPDVIRYTYQRLGKFKAANVMLDLTPYISKADYEDFADGFIAGCSYEGQIVALPHHTDVLATFYNKRMFEEQGFRIPESIEDGYSWEEIADMGRQLKEAYDLPYGIAGIWENNSGYRFLPFIYMNGGALLNEDQTEVTMDTEEVREALDWYADLRSDDTMINTGFTAPMVANNVFVAEQCGIDFAGSWHMSTMQENLPDNWGVTYMPQRDGVTGNFIPVRESIMGTLEYKNYADEMAIFNEMAGTIDAKMAADKASVLNAAFSDQRDKRDGDHGDHRGEQDEPAAFVAPPRILFGKHAGDRSAGHGNHQREDRIDGAVKRKQAEEQHAGDRHQDHFKQNKIIIFFVCEQFPESGLSKRYSDRHHGKGNGGITHII